LTDKTYGHVAAFGQRLAVQGRRKGFEVPGIAWAVA